MKLERLHFRLFNALWRLMGRDVRDETPLSFPEWCLWRVQVRTSRLIRKLEAKTEAA